MDSMITEGIEISVQAKYQPSYSTPAEQQYIFSYDITITNKSPRTVQLLRRHWVITDGLGIVREVEGEGVIGKQPILQPGESHQYSSWCPLNTPLGFMEGQYLMVDPATEESFQAQVPRFRLESPVVLN